MSEANFMASTKSKEHTDCFPHQTILAWIVMFLKQCHQSVALFHFLVCHIIISKHAKVLLICITTVSFNVCRFCSLCQ